MPAQRNQADEQQFQALVAAQAQARAQIAAQMAAMAVASARAFHGWYSADAITEWAAKLAAQMEAMQRAVAQLTDAYMARSLSLLTGSRIRPIGRVDTSALRAGVTHPGAYARGADVYRWQQSQFDAIARSLLTDSPRVPDLITPAEAAARRIADVADLDAQLAARAQEHASLTDAGERGLITGWRRVIHPELSKGGTCGLCIAASDRLYGPTEPRAIHLRCECTTLPVVDGVDPGSQLNRSDLNRLYKQAGGTGRQKLAATRYQIDEHGELGPVLNPRGAKVRTARQAARDTNRVEQAKTDAEKAAQIARIRDQLTQALPKARELAREDPNTWGNYLSSLEARIGDLGQQLAA